ncbi:MAG: hypothetical protein AUJ96_21770 [Armatimonadetes bacterium CG2_30_66_41]|nr:hypothetical protein [Armatimonadota bacterium]OIO98190.1 MAG: hypothetical protein AUJ96_21770 [Armatimonadetes bacterium CG2_30_66_41]
MARRKLTSLVVALLAAPVLNAVAADYVWIEAENTAFTNLKPEIKGWGRQQFLSGEKWLHVAIDAVKVDQELPAEGGLLQYAFNLDKRGTYEVWNRIGYEFARSQFDWRVDGGEWTSVSPQELTTDLMELQTWNEVAWLKLGEKPLTAGSHKLDIRLPKAKDDKGKTARVLYASDLLCVHLGPFHPNSKFRPAENYRTPEDEQAAKQVYELPAPANAGARSSVVLNGLWEVCRDDEQSPGEVAEPLKALPEHPYWRAIQVPGDKSKLRPDLIFCHRLWYRTRVNVPASQAGRSFYLVFPQNNLNTTVFVNGVFCGFNKNPFARFSLDVTKGLKPGANEVWVGIRDCYYGFSANPDKPRKLRRTFNYPIDWWNKGFMDLAYPVWNHPQSGILVTPELVSAGPVYAADAFCKPSVAKKELAVELTLSNPSGKAASGEVLCEAVNAKTDQVEKAFAPKAFALEAGTEQTVEVTEKWDNPKLWWPDDPNLYRLRTTVRLGGQAVDVADTTFGFREWNWAGRDFKLNGIPFHGWADCHTAGSEEEWLANYRKFNETVMRFWGTSWQGLPPDQALSFYDENGVVCRRSGVLDGEAIGYYAIERDEDLKKRYNSGIKMDLMDNWRDQVVAQVKGERNHPSVMVWSMENEWLYINCINLYGGLMDKFEDEVTKTSQAVLAVDPTRPNMVDGGGATKAQTLPVHGDHYVASKPQDYPELAYAVNPKGGGRGRWEWDEQRPRFLGEDFFMTGNHPEVAYFEGEGAFAGKPRRGVAIWERILQEGYRWAGQGAWQFWLGQTDTDQNQYIAFAPRAVFCRQWDWTFESGQAVRRTFGIFNDTHYDDPLTFTWTLMLGGKKVAGESKPHAVPPGENAKFDVTIPLPKVTGRQEGKLFLKLAVKGQEVFSDTKDVSVLAPSLGAALAAASTERSSDRSDGSDQSDRSGKQILAALRGTAGTHGLFVYDPAGTVGPFLRSRSIPFTSLDSLDKLPPDGKVLIVGKDALDSTESTSSRLAAYAAGDRRVIVLEQINPLRYQGLPADMQAAVNVGRTAFGEDLEHPVLRGLQQKDFFTWGADKLVYQNAYQKPGRGAKSLVQCDDHLRYTALAEVPVGNGLMLLSQLMIGEQLPTSAVAKQLLLNLIGYAATYKLEFYQVAAAIADSPLFAKALDAMGLQYTKADGPLQALTAQGAKTAIVNASPANLKTLVDNQKQVDAFTAAGGSLVLCGLTPEGLADYNKLVGVDHMIRPFKRERVLFPPVRDRLTSGLTTGDVVLFSSERIFSWTAGNYAASDVFSYVVDYDEVASFGKSPFFAYDNITNGFVSADGWPLIINFPKNEDDSPYDVPIALQKPQTLTEFTWIGNVFYYPQTKVNLLFDGKQDDKLSFDVAPNAEPQTFEIKPPRPANEVTVQIAGWTPVPDKAPNLGIDNVYFKAQRSPEFYRDVKQMLNVGGLLHYVKGKGNIVLCNLLFKDNEEVPENAVKKRTLLAAILRNLKAPFAGGKTLIAGANLEYTPLDIAKQATQYRDDRGWFGEKQFTFKDMPTGKQTFAGVPFQIYDFPTSPVPTVVMLAGDRVPHQLPNEVKGIPVNQKADALFFLQTARIDARRNQQELRENKQYEMLRYVVTYADGQTADIPIYAEVDLDDYHPQTAAALPGAQLAWTTPYDGTDRSAAAYLKQWNNPRPKVAIKSLDMVYGADRRGVPVLLAVTAARAAG